ncbi:type I restriction-modification system subunit M [Candidatus Falkowbacteria bacterium]|uniref:site-specific DNA-methyltransferase (adenine-specific) n=1 Tax=Candidatus Buchananbacteria bacterium CG10_big_fil_rev_8_21_14_0_10_33_19 TaxID=1974525 RepID=A0A2H0W2W5_9BACT|nr:type I restriction-modification system subunit M [Candidatus Falkowbacteria bacterium]PIS05678.1 MAG: type I restriction-modification system subunit M [Candidatus Buchananbacteria bacterium CG10_big_fil_rev_8_21_14_0_10_33_19]
MTTKKYTQEDLNKILWQAADSSRTQVDAGIYKDYVLVMLFFKYLSDLSKKKHNEYKERFGNDEKRIEEKMKLDRFYLPPKVSFDYIYKVIEQDNLGEEIDKALHAIEDANKEKLENMFLNVSFNSEVLGKSQERNKMLRHLVHDFAKIDLSDVKDDIIGNSYMYMIERFGADAGKKAGEFFTVRNVAHLVAKFAEPKAGSRICDPCMGSGGLLLLAGEEVEKLGSKNYALYGQESTGSTYQLARMNMFLHGKDSARLEWGDTLNNPLLVENDKLMKFDTIVANMPFSLSKWGAENAGGDKYNRFWRGVPPKDKGDFAFITHMVETLKAKTGRMVAIAPHGVLFRGGAEGKIREQLLKENVIDAVIGLPAGLFQTTGIPVAILILDRTREKGGENEKTKDVFFIEASKEFKAQKAQNILTDENIEKIYSTYKKRKDVEKLARKVSIKEIEENDFNLNITRYVDTFVEEEPVDIKANLEELAKLEPELQKLEKQMVEYLKELGIK